ncbi:SusC/RagA family TonB-linked outer membrane protein [Sphingobacterium suaedae]|uniref:SusC/RagA family TonB-linked outer membrane protein n=1 Tax=Sphingobacterium suaedae TaxID=1686402 RepID=A0ABW5KF43_9SPHI
MKNSIILLCLLCSGYISAYAQTKPLKGRVSTANSGAPLAGVTVVAVQSQLSTTSDEQGVFELVLPNSETAIELSFVGYQKQLATIKGLTTIDVLLVPDDALLDEVVVTGYSAQKKADLTGAVSVIKISDVENVSSSNIMQSLTGRVAGMQVQSSGAPDGGATIRIRGIGTLGNNDPLYIIDGVPSKRSMNELNSNDIESIQVLKDASSSSIYGSRAANGVIIITTKRGKAGETKVDFRTSLKVQNYGKSLNLLNTWERGYVQWRAALNDGINPNFGVYKFKWHTENNADILDEVILPEYLDVNKTMFPADTDWQKEVGRTGLAQNYNMTLTSGTEKGHALFSLDYVGNQGTVKGTNFSRISTRINSDYYLIDKMVRIGENFSLSKIRKSVVDPGWLLNLTHEIWPIVPIHTIDGVGWGGPVSGMGDRHNPIRIIEDNKQNREDFLRLFGDIYIGIEPIKNLHLQSKFGIDYVGFWKRNMQLKYVSGFMSENTNRVDNNANYGGNWILSNTANYKFDLGKHNFDMLAGQELIKYSYEEFSAGRNDFAVETPEYMYLNVGTGDMRVGGWATAYSLASFFGKLNYNYDNRYLFSGTLRHDGSSRFGENNRWGTFPAFSLGWRISQENFFKDVLSVVPELKLRYGWGRTGNQEIGDYASYGIYQALYGSRPIDEPDYGTAYDIYGSGGGSLPSGFRRTQMANPNLKWEGTTQNNIGVDMELFGRNVILSFDYFHKLTKDILVKPPFIGTIGEGGDRWVNGASMKNTGFEAVATYYGKIGEVEYSIAANASHYRNKITELPDDVLGSYAGNGNDQTILGRPLSSMYGHLADGLFRTQDEVDAHVAQTGKGLGRIRYKNTNNDDKIDDDDRVWLGHGDPKLLYGINLSTKWKNFDLSMFWNGVYGLKVNNGVKRYSDFIGFFSGHNYGDRTLEAWTPQHSSSTIPALSLNDLNNEQRFSSYFVENASYLKLANLEIGYTLSRSTEAKLLKNARFYFIAQNIATMKSKNFTGVDPEVPNLAYPIPFSLTFGTNITF